MESQSRSAVSESSLWTQGSPKTLSEGLQSQNYCHHNVKFSVAFFTVLAITLKMQCSFSKAAVVLAQMKTVASNCIRSLYSHHLWFKK
jgi:hypothetical protein